MTKRTSRGFVKKDEVLAKIKRGREGAIQLRTEAKINSPEYKAADSLLQAIDKIAGILTGDEKLFSL